MGNETKPPTHTIRLPSAEYRWYKRLPQSKENESINGSVWEPFPLDQSLQIEYHYQQNKFYEKGDIMVAFENENQNYHLLINKINPWDQIKIERFQSSDSLCICRQGRRQLFHSERISANDYSDFSEAYASKMAYAFYSNVFKDFKQEQQDEFMNQFINYSTVIEQSLYDIIKGEYSRSILLAYNLKDEAFTFAKLKTILMDDFDKEKQLIGYKTTLIEHLTPEEFCTTIISCFNEEGCLYSTLLDLLKSKELSLSPRYLMYYLCLLFSFDQISSLNQFKARKVFFDTSLCQTELFNQLKRNYYALNDLYFISDLLVAGRHPNDTASIQIEIDLENESFIYPFLQLYPYDISESSLFNESDIIIRQYSVLKCIGIERTKNDVTVIRFKLMENIISNVINCLKITKRKDYGIHEELCAIANDEYLSVAHAKVKQKKFGYLKQKFPQCQELNFYDNQIGNEGMNLVSSCFNSLTRLKWLNFTGNEIGLAGMKAFSLNTKHLKQLTYLNFSFNMICDTAISFIDFSHLPSLKYLILKVNSITDTGMAYLSSQIKYLTQLIELDMYDNQIGNKGLIALSNQFNLFSDLKRLNLYNCSADDEGFEVFFSKWNQLTSLTTLFLKNNSFGKRDKVNDLLLDSIVNMKQLEYLNLCQNSMPMDIMKRLINIVVKSELNLVYCSKTCEFIQGSVSRVVKKKRFDLNQIQSLNYSNQLNVTLATLATLENEAEHFTPLSLIQEPLIKNSFNNKGASHNSISNEVSNSNQRSEGSSISKVNQQLKRSKVNSFQRKSLIAKLNKRQLLINDSSFEYFIKYASQITALEQLSFCELPFSYKMSKQLSSVYPSISSISFLNLSFCELNNELLSILLFNADLLLNLTELDLSSNNLGEEGLKTLSSFSHQLSSLESISLCWNNINSNAMKAFSTSLCYLINLKKIDLYGNHIEDEGLKAFSENLPLLINLEYLNLGTNFIGNGGVKALCQCFFPLMNLTELYLNDNMISNESIPILFSYYSTIARLKYFDLTNNLFSASALKEIGSQGIPFSFKI